MSAADTNDLTSQCVVYYDLACGRGDVGGQRRGVSGAPLGVVLSWLRDRQGEVAVLRGRREGAYGMRIRRCVDGEEQGHVLDIVEIDDIDEDDGKASAVEADGEDGGGKGQLAYDGRPLVKQASISGSFSGGKRWGRVGESRRACYFCILDDQMARVEDQSDERGGEEHLDDADMAFLFGDDFLGTEDSGKGVGVEDAVALGGADGDAAVVLVECDEVDGGRRERQGKRGSHVWGFRDQPGLEPCGINSSMSIRGGWCS